VDNSKAEESLEWVEVAVAMKEGVTLGETEGCNEAVDGLSYCVAA
jgi:hypothetical protein